MKKLALLLAMFMAGLLAGAASARNATSLPSFCCRSISGSKSLSQRMDIEAGRWIGSHWSWSQEPVVFTAAGQMRRSIRTYLPEARLIRVSW